MKANVKILLVNPGKYLYAYPSLGVGYLSAYLKKYSTLSPQNIDLVDENAKEDVERYIKINRPRIIGISATTPQISRAHQIAKFCKGVDPNIICIIGGVHITVLPKTTLKEFPAFDIGVCGEGEETFCELIDTLCENNFVLDKIDLAAINGLVYRDGADTEISTARELIKDLDKIPIPDRRAYNLRYYRRPRQVIRGFACRATQMMSSRGCPYHCRFCSSPLMWRRRVRFHSPERFINEVTDLLNLGFNGFYLHDDTFIAKKDRVAKICKLMIDRNYHKRMIWGAQLRPNLIRTEEDVKMLRLMERAGCVQVEYGFESGSQKILSFLKREAATVGQNQRAIELTKKTSLRIFGNFIMGTQGETKEDILKTRKFVLENMQKLDYYQVYVATPYPGTELWDICKRRDLLQNVTWEKFGMGILDNKVFSDTVDQDFVLETIQELTQKATGKIALSDKLKWLAVRTIDNPNYVFKMLKNHFYTHDAKQ
ncbi:B12-binding domain-containing radical SAM protein [Patescibacteria group bacterium]